jgi:hypothetical protein
LFRYRVPASLRYFTFVALLLLGSTVSALAQSSAVSPFNNQDNEILAVPLNSQAGATATDPPKKSPLGALTTGWTYLWADQGNNYRSNLNGWFLRPSVNVGRGYSLFFDSTNYYGTNAKGSVNSHGFTFGLGKELFPKARVKPSIFAEAGDVRASSAGTITNQFAFAAGASFSIPINKHVDLAVTPAEWVFLYPNGDPRNDYNAKVGLSFPFGHR